MGEAKRQQTIDLQHWGQPNLTQRDLEQWAILIAPKSLALQLAQEIDAEWLLPEAESPGSWPHTMRCICASSVARHWIALQLMRHPQASSPIAYTNLVKVLAMAVNSVDLEEIYGT